MIKQLLLSGLTVILVSSFISNKKKEFLPPGTVKINDTLYADETEVTNFSWSEYENWTKNKFGANSPQHISTLPDTLVWREKNSYNEPYVQYYYRHPAYKDYPVVGISHEQVVEFCKWRKDRVKEYLSRSKKYTAVEFEYRLPSKNEWEFISGDCENMLKDGGRNEKGMITFNHRWARDSAEWVGSGSDKDRIGMEVFAPVYSYWPNKFKLWQMIGNVSEMVSEKGISKGGSWRNLLEECRVGKDIPYEKPSAMLGFRCVCVVKNKNS